MVIHEVLRSRALNGIVGEAEAILASEDLVGPLCLTAEQFLGFHVLFFLVCWVSNSDLKEQTMWETQYNKPPIWG